MVVSGRALSLDNQRGIYMNNPMLAKMVGPNWHPNQKQAENVLRLVAAESPEDLDEVIEKVQSLGLTVPEFIKPARCWGDFNF